MMLFAVFCGIACVALVASEHRGWRPGVLLFKPLASLAFVATAVAAGALESSYGQLVLLALCLSLVGDVLLIPRDREGLFLAGIGSFLLGHVAFCAAFWVRGVDSTVVAVSGLAVAVGAGLALRWLVPHLAGIFRVAVPAYIAVIGLMVALAAGATAVCGDGRIAVGAVLFAVSDLAVARERMIAHDFRNGAIGLPLYFGAQVLLATTVAGVA